MIQEMRQSLPDVNATVVSYHADSSVQQYTTRASSWLRQTSSNFLTAFRWHDPNHTGLPHYNNCGTAMKAGVVNSSTPHERQSTLHLMACVHRTREDVIVLQNDVRTISNDQALFNFLRSKISQRRNRLLLAFSCRAIQGIFFSKVSRPTTIKLTRQQLTNPTVPSHHHWHS
jgi:hypothetical protein